MNNTMALNLKELVDEIMMVDVDHNLWYSPSMDQFYETDQDLPADAVQLPDKMERDDYGMIRDFSQSRTGEERSWLVNAIAGRGAFHRFRSVLQRFDLESDWYRWQENALTDLAVEWCEDHGIPYGLTMHDADTEEDNKLTCESEPAKAGGPVVWRIVEINKNNYMRLVLLKAAWAGYDVSSAQQDLEMDLQQLHVYAASIQGQYGGYLEVSDDGVVVEVYVDPSMRRKGAGRALLKEASNNFGPLVIHLPAGHKDAQSFFAACGYGHIGYFDLYPDSTARE